MAPSQSKRYGGKYSPGSAGAGKTPRNVELVRHPRKTRRLRVYRAMTIPIAIAALMKIPAGEPIEALALIFSVLAIWFATEMTEAGIEAEKAYNERIIARAPAWPRKLIGAGLTGFSIFIAAFLGLGSPLLTSMASGLVGLIGMLMSFGLDPVRAKGLSGERSREAERAADAIERAEKLLDDIRELARGFKDRGLRLEVENLAVSADEMFRTLERDPGRFRNSRRYLSVYLEGARDATKQYLALPHDKEFDIATRKYQALVRELDAGFRQKRELMLEDNRGALDVEIDVLRERLASEGVAVSAISKEE